MSASGEPIGRHISVVVMGNTNRDHPIEDAIMDAAHLAGDRYGFDVTVGSGPYFYEGDETDRKLAEVTAQRDRFRKALEEIADHPANLPWPQKWTHWSGLAREALEVDCE